MMKVIALVIWLVGFYIAVELKDHWKRMDGVETSGDVGAFIIWIVVSIIIMGSN
jgi:hypothetical protein